MTASWSVFGSTMNRVYIMHTCVSTRLLPGIFLAFQICGSKGSYGQNLGNIGVAGFIGSGRTPVASQDIENKRSKFSCLRQLEAKSWKHGSYGDSGPPAVPFWEQRMCQIVKDRRLSCR